VTDDESGDVGDADGGKRWEVNISFFSILLLVFYVHACTVRSRWAPVRGALEVFMMMMAMMMMIGQPTLIYTSLIESTVSFRGQTLLTTGKYTFLMIN